MYGHSSGIRGCKNESQSHKPARFAYPQRILPGRVSYAQSGQGCCATAIVFVFAQRHAAQNKWMAAPPDPLQRGSATRFARLPPRRGSTLKSPSIHQITNLADKTRQRRIGEGRRDGQAHHRYPRIEARCVKNSCADRARGAGTHIAYNRISLPCLESFCFNAPLCGYALQVAARLSHERPWCRLGPGSPAPIPPCLAARGPRA